MMKCRPVVFVWTKGLSGPVQEVNRSIVPQDELYEPSTKDAVSTAPNNVKVLRRSRVGLPSSDTLVRLLALLPLPRETYFDHPFSINTLNVVRSVVYLEYANHFLNRSQRVRLTSRIDQVPPAYLTVHMISHTVDIRLQTAVPGINDSLRPGSQFNILETRCNGA